MRSTLLVILGAMCVAAATRPHYGGTLRVEIREPIDTPDPPALGRGIPDLARAFTIKRWEAGRRATFEANESAPGGRPFIDTVEVMMGRPLRDQSIDLELGKADLVELGPAELRRQNAARKVWSSSPVRVLTLVFGPRVEDARVREALALAVDRAAIHGVLLQRQGEVSAALLPQSLSGFAFVFPAAPDPARARTLAPGARPLSLGFEDAALRPIAERIALDARNAALTVTIASSHESADVRLVELRVVSADPARALAAMAAALGLPEPGRVDSPDALYAAERALLEGFRVVPLIHLPDVYGAAPNLRGAGGITPLGEWRFENLWLEGGRP